MIVLIAVMPDEHSTHIAVEGRFPFLKSVSRDTLHAGSSSPLFVAARWLFIGSAHKSFILSGPPAVTPISNNRFMLRMLYRRGNNYCCYYYLENFHALVLYIRQPEWLSERWLQNCYGAILREGAFFVFISLRCACATPGTEYVTKMETPSNCITNYELCCQSFTAPGQ